MSATYTLTRPTPNPDYTEGPRKRRVRDVALSGTYTTGGDALLASAFGLRRIDELLVHTNATDGTLAYPCVYIYSSGKLKLFETSASASTGLDEKGSGESLTGITVRVTVIGV